MNHQKPYASIVWLISMLLILLAPAAVGQTQKQFVKVGDKSFKTGDYYGAAYYYSKALGKDSSKLATAEKLAHSYRLQNDYKQAAYWYFWLMEWDVKRRFPGTHFWLASMQKCLGDYQSAQKNFKFFRKNASRRNDPKYRKAKQEMKSCAFALEALKDSSQITVTNIGPALNTPESEFAPVLLDDTTMFFTTLRYDTLRSDNSIEGRSFARIHRAVYRNEAWQDLVELDTVINNPRVNAANGSFSTDSTRFYFSKCPPDLNCAIYETRLENGLWTRPKKLPAAINREGFNSTQPAIGMLDGQEYLFFVTDRPGGRGGLDIWYIPFTDGTRSVRSRNMGSRINSIEDDICPFYDQASKTFYFSSSWKLGFGGMDVFKASGENPRRLSKAQNMGVPVNSPANDMYFSLRSDIGTGFLTSNRSGSLTRQGETCCNDIYLVKTPLDLPVDTLTPPPVITLQELQDYLPITLYFHNDRPNPRTRDTVTSLTYLDTYHEFIGLEDEYINAMVADVAEEEERLAVEDDVVQFFGDFVDEGVDKLELVAENLIKELEAGHQIELAVKGYASPLAKSDYNLNLTLRRINSMVNYLETYEQGIYKPYLDGTAANGGKLTIRKIPFGEERANQQVSDKLSDQKASIYSRAAALERKIEILAISRTEKKADTNESTPD